MNFKQSVFVGLAIFVFICLGGGVTTGVANAEEAVCPEFWNFNELNSIESIKFDSDNEYREASNALFSSGYNKYTLADMGSIASSPYVKFGSMENVI